MVPWVNTRECKAFCKWGGNMISTINQGILYPKPCNPKLLFESGSSAFQDYWWMLSPKCWALSPAMRLFGELWLPASWWLCKAIHPHHLHSHLQKGMSGSPGTSLSSLGLTCLELVSKLYGLNTAGHHRIARASYNACTPLTAFSCLSFSPHTWDLIYGP